MAFVRSHVKVRDQLLSLGKELSSLESRIPFSIYRVVHHGADKHGCFRFPLPLDAISAARENSLPCKAMVIILRHAADIPEGRTAGCKA